VKPESRLHRVTRFFLRHVGGTGGSAMTMDQELEQLVAHLARSLQKARESAQASEVELANAQQALAVLAALCLPSEPVPASAPQVRVAIANGRRLTENEAQAAGEDTYDVVLDMTASTLRYRKDPVGHSPPKLANLQGIGPYRIRILAFMIEHPSTPLCADNVDQFLGDAMRSATPQAFTKNISILRQALGGGGSQNAYIQSIFAWESSRSHNARAYRLNPQWKYLVIRHGKSGESLISHEEGCEKVTAVKYNESREP
jgi:hypothetical protein